MQIEPCCWWIKILEQCNIHNTKALGTIDCVRGWLSRRHLLKQIRNRRAILWHHSLVSFWAKHWDRSTSTMSDISISPFTRPRAAIPIQVYTRNHACQESNHECFARCRGPCAPRKWCLTDSSRDLCTPSSGGATVIVDNYRPSLTYVGCFTYMQCWFSRQCHHILTASDKGSGYHSSWMRCRVDTCDIPSHDSISTPLHTCRDLQGRALDPDS